MRRRPLVLWGITVVLVLLSLVLSVGRDGPSDLVLYSLLPLSVATVGALILSHHPTHHVGWIFAVFGAYLAVGEILDGYSLLAADTGLPGGDLAAWVFSWSWTAELAVWAVVAAIFPDGHLQSRRWRWVPWTAALGATLTSLALAVGPLQNDSFESGVNPFLVDGPAVDALLAFGSALLVGSILGGTAALVVRLRRSRGVERQQLKWFAVAASVVALSGPVLSLLSLRYQDVELLKLLAFNGLPIVAAVGVAILRYRLYDVDLVIKRTLVYTTLTVSLVGTYLLSVLLLQTLLRPVAGSSDLAVAASTLAVAALFRPLRSAIQRVVDRRFFRSRYDASRTLDRFSASLRDELDLDSLGTDLRSVVHHTMQPEHVSLWLRSDGPA